MSLKALMDYTFVGKYARWMSEKKRRETSPLFYRYWVSVSHHSFSQNNSLHRTSATLVILNIVFTVSERRSWFPTQFFLYQRNKHQSPIPKAQVWGLGIQDSAQFPIPQTWVSGLGIRDSNPQSQGLTSSPLVVVVLSSLVAVVAGRRRRVGRQTHVLLWKI